ncbi:LuxR C-terminal-related transcriptional regulator [Paenibacillus sp. TRM 82003]|nr:LuxR C-terminal-related transcriptional regulator [Paenibacillus sp. TRM 82003]
MTIPIVSTKLNIPPMRAKLVHRARLLNRLSEGAEPGLALVCAPAGYGKTTLAADWLAGLGRPAAWLSLDAEHNEFPRFLTYLVAALQAIAPGLGEDALAALQGPDLPSVGALLAPMLNDIAGWPQPLTLVLDDYHVVTDETVHEAVSFLVEHLPPRLRLTILTREDPPLPVARLRARDRLTELRAEDLRFTRAEAAAFFADVMEQRLEERDIALLDARAEGWIAGLQLAALSMRGRDDAARFVASFAGDDRDVADYFVDEIVLRQPKDVQTFLLNTSILDRMCGPLCDAVLGVLPASGQDMLERLDRANLFLVPLDRERRWYRYHHLFGELLRRRLERAGDLNALHARASRWYEENGLEVEALRHAAAAGDVDRAARLVEGDGMPMHFRGGAGPVLQWVESLPASALDARPPLRIIYASALLMIGRLPAVEPQLLAAEATLCGDARDDRRTDLLGHIAAIRAALAVSRHDVSAILEHSRRTLDLVHPDNLPVRASAVWSLGYAHQLRGDRAAAGQAYAEAFAISDRIGHRIIAITSAIGLGSVQEGDNRLREAAETYRDALRRAGDPPLPIACEAHLGLARMHYERNELASAARHAERGLALAQAIEHTDRAAICLCWLARIRLAQGDASGAASSAAMAEQLARRGGFEQPLAEAASVRLLVSLRRGALEEAERLVAERPLPVMQARILLGRGDAHSALRMLEAERRALEARGWENERLRVMTLEAVALYACGEATEARRRLRDALSMAEPNGFVRLFLDEGAPMARLLAETAGAARHSRSDYVRALLAAAAEGADVPSPPPDPPQAASCAESLIEPLSPREMDILRLIAEGRSNEEIARLLHLALSTVKGHNRNIFGKLQAERRTEAVARARELGLL